MGGIRGRSQLYNGKVMNTGADRGPIVAPLIWMGTVSVVKLHRYVYSMLSHARIRFILVFCTPRMQSAGAPGPANLSSASSSVRTLRPLGQAAYTDEQVDYLLPLPRDQSLRYLLLPCMPSCALACLYQGAHIKVRVMQYFLSETLSSAASVLFFLTCS